MEYNRSGSCARAFGRAGRIEEWVHAYLLSDGNNKPFSDGLKLEKRYWDGPVKMPLSLLTRCCGAEENMKWQVPRDSFEIRVAALMEAVRQKADLPPLIVSYGADGFVVNDGNHRLEALKRMGVLQHDVIIWTTQKADFDAYLLQFGREFHQNES